MKVFALSQTTNKLVNKTANDSARVSGQDRKIPHRKYRMGITHTPSLKSLMVGPLVKYSYTKQIFHLC